MVLRMLQTRTRFASYLYFFLKIDRDRGLQTRIYDKHDDLNVPF